jgi:chromosomal replication initiation ATPase DnaA
MIERTYVPEFVMPVLREEAQRYGTTVASILAGDRHRNVVYARAAACLRLRGRGKHASLPAIGRWLGLHHTSVLHLIRVAIKREAK